MKDVMLRLNVIRELLEKEGFRTSWRNPFMKWQHPDLYAEESGIETGKILYVLDPPISWVAPFDIAVVSIRIDEGIYFNLSLYYVHVLEDQTESSIINEIYDQHQYWHNGVVSFYNNVAKKFSLKWDTEFDCYIEDSLYGHLESEESILNILIMMKNKDENRIPWIYWNAADWSSDFPEIDCKLKEYRDCIDLISRIIQ